MKKIVLCDLDHVLCDSFWRDAMIGGPGGWDAYHAAAHQDQLVWQVAAMVNALATTFDVYGLTARPEKWRTMTMAWLVRHGVRIECLLMRGDRDFRPSPQVKLDLVKNTWSPIGDHIALLIDDRDDVCAAFRAEGIVVLQAHVARTTAPSIPFTDDTAGEIPCIVARAGDSSWCTYPGCGLRWDTNDSDGPICPNGGGTMS